MWGGLGVRGKYVCSGMNFVKWLNYSDNNLMDLEGRTACVMTVFVRVCVSEGRYQEHSKQEEGRKLTPFFFFLK